MRSSTTALVSLVIMLATVTSTASASAATPAPGWTISSQAAPTNFSTNDNALCLAELGNAVLPSCDSYTLTAMNVGSKATNGGQVTLTDTVPAGLKVQKVSLFAPGAGLGELDLGAFLCTTAPVQCEYPGELGGILPEALAPDDMLRMVVYVTVEPGVSGALSNSGTVTGGGAAPVSTPTTGGETNEISSDPPQFGVSAFSSYLVGADGEPDTQAGDHPYELTTTIDFASAFRKSEGLVAATSVQDVKDIVVDLPLGVVGNALSAPTCTLAQLSATATESEPPSSAGCPADTRVGHISTFPKGSDSSIDGSLYHMVSERGVAAEYGFIDGVHGTHILYASVAPSPAGYVLRITSREIPQIELTSIVVSFYGDPAARDDSGGAAIPTFTNPSVCSGKPLTTTIHVDSWKNPGSNSADGSPDFDDPRWASASYSSPPVTGCNLLHFDPTIEAQPTTHVADSPSGLEFGIKLPQSENVATLATPPLKQATVTLPAGMTVDPSAGNGLGACSEAQIGFTGVNPQTGTDEFTAAPPECPESAKIGSLELTTPLIPGTLTGEMYLAAQDENPFESLLAAYVVVDDPTTGVLIKLAGEFEPDPQTGQITAVFDQAPQLPFSELKLHFFGGPRAELTTPDSCGMFTTTSDLSPWSAPDSGPDATPFDSYETNSGCVSGFGPSFTAGSTNLQAGAYSPFVVSFTREDTDQELGGLSVSLPPGLLANIASVPLCNDAQATVGACPEASLVGTVLAGAGPGPNPLFETGKAYLTGPYNGGSYGLSVVVPAIAGPFNFGDVVVRQSLRIDARNAHVTDVSDPFPTILDPVGANGQTGGIPIKLRRIDVDIDRPGFTFNPTNCSRLAVVGQITSMQSTSATLATPFQVTNCQTLKFSPKVAVSTIGHASKANGASLNFKITYPRGALGTQSWFNEAKFDLPKQLSVRLATIQKACLASVFEANPAACPAASAIGHVIVHTPILPVALTGSVYFVSYGGVKFPEAVMVLTGDNVTVDLHGETYIASDGQTSATFKNTPDVPFESIEVTIPTGPFSEFGANLPEKNHYDLCGQKLIMPTLFKAQNGLEINQNTTIDITGCPKSKASTRAQKLAAALKACKHKAKSRRTACARTARKKFGATASKTSKGHKK